MVSKQGVLLFFRGGGWIFLHRRLGTPTARQSVTHETGLGNIVFPRTRDRNLIPSSSAKYYSVPAVEFGGSRIGRLDVGRSDRRGVKWLADRVGGHHRSSMNLGACEHDDHSRFVCTVGFPINAQPLLNKKDRAYTQIASDLSTPALRPVKVLCFVSLFILTRSSTVGR